MELAEVRETAIEDYLGPADEGVRDLHEAHGNRHQPFVAYRPIEATDTSASLVSTSQHNT